MKEYSIIDLINHMIKSQFEWSNKEKMRKYLIFSVLLSLILFSSCKDEKSKVKDIDVKSIISELEKSDYYKKFIEYNIIPRQEGRVYIILNDSLGEFWVWYSEGDNLELKKSEKGFDYKLKSLYSDKYLQIKNKILSTLNEIISFMIKKGISSVNSNSQRIEFGMNNNISLIKYYFKVSEADLKLFQELNFETEILNNKWIIIKKPDPKLRQK
jgi:hypothetical protein